MKETQDRESVRAFRSTFPEPEAVGFRSAAWRFGVPGPTESIDTYYPTIVDALVHAAEVQPPVGIRLLDEEDEDVAPTFRTHAEILSAAKKCASALLEKGLARGERVLIVLPTSFDFIVSFFGIMIAGGIPVPSYPPAMLEKLEIALDRLHHVARHAEVAFCITTPQLRKVLGDLATSHRGFRGVESMDALANRGEELGEATIAMLAPSDTAFLQYTSGSTGSPRGVRLTQANLCSNVHTQGQGVKMNRRDVVVSWLPLYHDMGLIGAVLCTVYYAIPLVLMSPLAFLSRPVRWLRAIHDYKGTISAAPNFSMALCVKRIRDEDRKGLDLSSWRVLLNGAEPVNYRHVVDFQRRFAENGFPENTILPVYGLAESTLAVSFPKPGEPVRYVVVRRRALAEGRVEFAEGQGTAAIVCLGTAMPGHELLVVDEAGMPLLEREVGHIVVRGPSVMRDYFHDEEETKRVLRNGWLWTGDLGFLHAGDLYVTGRAKDLIIARGHNYYAEDIERVAERVEGARPGGIVAFALIDEEKGTEVAILVCETTLTEEEASERKLASNLSEKISEQTGLKIDEVVLVAPGTIPKTSSGKRQRALTRQRYLADELVPQKTGKMRLALVFARSATGYLRMLTRSSEKRREPE